MSQLGAPKRVRYPNKQQAAALRDMLVLHQRLYNNCLEHRIRSYEWKRRVQSYRDLTEAEELDVKAANSLYGQHKQLMVVRPNCCPGTSADDFSGAAQDEASMVASCYD